MENWRAVYLFVADAQDLDTLALEAADAVAEETVYRNDWFFIRYTEGGVHLRLRIGHCASIGFHRIRLRMASTCRRIALGRQPSLWAQASAYQDGEGRIFEPGEAVYTPYEPETVRYAGPAGLVINERLFRESTAIATALIRATLNDLARRSAFAMDLMLMTVAAMLGKEADPQEFLSYYAASWREMWIGADVAPQPDEGRYVDLRPRFARHARVAAGVEGGANAVDAWGLKVVRARGEFERLHREGSLISPSTGLTTADDDDLHNALISLAHSQIHMLNNRLGLWPGTEIVLADRLVRRLGACPGTACHPINHQPNMTLSRKMCPFIMRDFWQD